MDSCPSNWPIEEQSFRRIEILSGTPRRRRWSAEEKTAVVTASLVPGAVARQVALRYGVHPNQLYAWRRWRGRRAVGDRRRQRRSRSRWAARSCGWRRGSR